MKRIAFFTLALTLALLLPGCKPAQPKPDDTAVLRYDGIYCYIRDFDNDGLLNNYALRFYEDGTVIHASVEQKDKDGNYFPQEDWFRRDGDYYADLLGHYELTDGSITLTTYSPRGSVEYQGSVQQDKLVLNSRSAGGYEVNNSQYVFHPFENSSELVLD